MGNPFIDPFMDLLKYHIQSNYINYDDNKLNMLLYSCLSIVISIIISITINIASGQDILNYTIWFIKYRIFRIQHRVILTNANNTPYSPDIPMTTDKGRLDVSNFTFYDLYDNQQKWFLEIIGLKLYKNHSGNNSTYVYNTIYKFNIPDIIAENQNQKLNVSRKTFNSYFKSKGDNYKIIAFVDGYYILIDITSLNTKKKNEDEDENSIRLISNNTKALNTFMEIIQKDIDENKYIFKKAGTSGLEVFEFSSKTGSLTVLGEVKAKQTFDNFISYKKKYIIKKLDSFKNETLYDSKLSIENNLGILINGPYGTGKSHLISAIANYLKMNILVVKLSGMSKSDFVLIMKLAQTHNCIISFEEFDSLISDFLENNKSDQTADLQMKMQIISNQINACSDKELIKPLVEQMKELMENSNSNRLTYDSFLTIISGLISVSGRVMIATTNFPEKIPKALLRAGRFDIPIYLGKFNDDEIKEWLCKVYNPDEKEKDIIEKKHFPKDKYTPAQLNMKTHEYNNINDIIDNLTKDNGDGGLSWLE